MFKIVCFLSSRRKALGFERIAPNADLYLNNSEVSQIEGSEGAQEREV